MNGKQVIKALKEEGWKIVRVSGSHHRLVKGSKGVSVHVHGARDLKLKTIKSIEKQTGVKLI
jgi:predicted RNA binding protein YcfA (HicA-like mRNA interferase family)